MSCANHLNQVVARPNKCASSLSECFKALHFNKNIINDIEKQYGKDGNNPTVTNREFITRWTKNRLKEIQYKYKNNRVLPNVKDLFLDFGFTERLAEQYVFYTTDEGEETCDQVAKIVKEHVSENLFMVEIVCKECLKPKQC